MSGTDSRYDVNAPGCSASWLTRTPSSRAILSRRRSCQERVDETRLVCVGVVEKENEELGRWVGGVGGSSMRDSPNIAERVFSSMPIKSLITRRVIRWRNDSSASDSGGGGDGSCMG